MNEKIANDLIKAMKEQDKFKLSVLRMLKSALQLEKINKKSDLTDNEVIMVVKKQIKMRQDSISEFQKFNKLAEIKTLEDEIACLKVYLPEELTSEEVDLKINEAFLKVKPTSIKDMGQIMKELQSISSVTDMSEVSKKVRDKLNSL